MNRKRFWKYALLFLALIWVVWRYWAFELINSPSIDFRIYYTYCQQALDGQNPFVRVPGDGSPGYVYPVFCLGILIPFASFEVETGELLWRLFNLGLVVTIIAVAIRLLLRTLPRHLSKRDRWIAGWVVGAIVLAFLPNSRALRQGQCEIVAHACLLLAMWQGYANHRRRTAFFLSMAILVKAMPILLIPAFLPFLGFSGLVTSVLIGVGYLLILALLGMFQWEWYLVTERIPNLSQMLVSPSESIYHNVARAWGNDVAARFVAPLEMLLFVLYLFGVYWLWRKKAGGIWTVCWGMAVLPLASRFLEYHHLLHLTPAYIAIYFLCKRFPAQTRGPRNLAILSFISIDLTLFYANVAMHRIAFFSCIVGIILLVVGTMWGGLMDARLRAAEPSVSLK